MNSDSLSYLFIGIAILLCSLGCLYLSLGDLGWRTVRRLLGSIVVWLTWFVVVTTVFVISRKFLAPDRQFDTLFDIVRELLPMLVVGISGLVAVFVSSKIIGAKPDRGVVNADSTSAGTPFRGLTLQRAFLVNLAAFVGLFGSIAIAMIINDIYYERFTDVTPTTSFQIYD